jgi:hypothetical protein
MAAATRVPPTGAITWRRARFASAFRMAIEKTSARGVKCRVKQDEDHRQRYGRTCQGQQDRIEYQAEKHRRPHSSRKFSFSDSRTMHSRHDKLILWKNGPHTFFCVRVTRGRRIGAPAQRRQPALPGRLFIVRKTLL